MFQKVIKDVEKSREKFANFEAVTEIIRLEMADHIRASRKFPSSRAILPLIQKGYSHISLYSSAISFN